MKAPPPPPDLEEDLLRLQHMESKLVMGLFDHPGVVPSRVEHQLRYALALASLTAFEPGAARRGGAGRRPEVYVRATRLTQWRNRVLDRLGDVLLRTADGKARVEGAAAALLPLLPQLEKTRSEVIEKYADHFSARHLDQELGIKTLVSVAGGGGGSGYVYIGAWDVLQNAGLVPGYVIGSSMGAVLGLFRALRRDADFDEYVALAKSMRPEDVFRFVSTRTRYGLPGVMRLFLHEVFGPIYRTELNTEMLLTDLEIPYESVVAGIRRSAFAETPEQYARSHHLHEEKRPGALQLRAQIATQLVRLVGFINPRVVQEISVGGDALTRDFNAVDAAGFSAAIPGILHYDVTRDDPHMDTILTELLDRDEVVALVDGGVANNVPVRTAWRHVHEGKIGTRNCYYLAFDCFHPQYTPGHLWLQAVTRLVGYQVALNDRYAQRRIRFSPTLSPLNLLPPPNALDKAVAWGRSQMSQELPRVQKFFERVRYVPSSPA
ncbi:MAG: patatin-like phospholipase family protein [Myxococcota bacterium]